MVKFEIERGFFCLCEESLPLVFLKQHFKHQNLQFCLASWTLKYLAMKDMGNCHLHDSDIWILMWSNISILIFCSCIQSLFCWQFAPFFLSSHAASAPLIYVLLSGRGNLPLAHFTLLSWVWPGLGRSKDLTGVSAWMILWLVSPTPCWNQLASRPLFCLATRPHWLPHETKVLLKTRRKPFNSLNCLGQDFF